MEVFRTKKHASDAVFGSVGRWRGIWRLTLACRALTAVHQTRWRWNVGSETSASVGVGVSCEQRRQRSMEHLTLECVCCHTNGRVCCEFKHFWPYLDCVCCIIGRTGSQRQTRLVFTKSTIGFLKWLDAWRFVVHRTRQHAFDAPDQAVVRRTMTLFVWGLINMSMASLWGFSLIDLNTWGILWARKHSLHSSPCLVAYSSEIEWDSSALLSDLHLVALDLWVGCGFLITLECFSIS
jgi:hypothetical protein